MGFSSTLHRSPDMDFNYQDFIKERDILHNITHERASTVNQFTNPSARIKIKRGGGWPYKKTQWKIW